MKDQIAKEVIAWLLFTLALIIVFAVALFVVAVTGGLTIGELIAILERSLIV